MGDPRAHQPLTMLKEIQSLEKKWHDAFILGANKIANEVKGSGWELHPTLIMEQGVTYRFDVSDSSMSGHPFRLSTTFDGTHNSGAEFTTGKTVIGTPGSAGAYVEYTLTGGVSTLYYYCTAHSDKAGELEDGGGAITVRPNSDPRM